MSKKIEKLTPEQIAKFPQYVEAWTRIGLCTDPADRPRAEAGIRKSYEIAGLSAPRIVWCSSPIAMAITCAIVKEFAKPGASVRASVGASVRASVGASVGASVWDSVGDSVWDSVGDSVGDSVWASVRASVRDSVWDSVGDSVWASVYGQHDANWLAFYKFFADECGLVQETEKLAGLWEVAQSANWFLPHANICWVSDRHCVVLQDENRRLHCETGPAVQYPDGWSIYAWHGTRVPAHWIDQRDTLDPNEVIKAENVEQRAAGAAIVGWPKMLAVLNAKCIDKHDDPSIGELIELTLPGLPEPGLFLKAHCPRNGIIVEGVPRVSDIDGLPIETAIAAQAWRIGDPQSEYIQPPKRT